MSRTSTYTARLDAHLATLATEAERSECLYRQAERFDREYATFQQRAAKGLPVDDASALDYVETILEIGKRQQRSPVRVYRTYEEMQRTGAANRARRAA